jgi:hypothetical protein
MLWQKAEEALIRAPMKATTKTQTTAPTYGTMTLFAALDRGRKVQIR